jgi:hypothetical protein
MESVASFPINDTRHCAREFESPNNKLVELLNFEHMFVIL